MSTSRLKTVTDKFIKNVLFTIQIPNNERQE